jgi:hypothetical protein
VLAEHLSPYAGSGHHVRMSQKQGHLVNDPLARLIDAWCERRELRPLAMLLPAYTANFGLTDDWARLMEALYDLRAWRRLPDEEQGEVERLIPIVERTVYRT